MTEDQIMEAAGLMDRRKQLEQEIADLQGGATVVEVMINGEHVPDSEDTAVAVVRRFLIDGRRNTLKTIGDRLRILGVYGVS